MSAQRLELRDLTVSLAGEGRAEILSRISLALEPGKRLGMVGESGSGKSALALAVMGLLPDIMRVRGSIRLGDEELVGRSDREMAGSRGRRMAMVFQEPMTALNPLRNIADQIAEGLTWHRLASRAEARKVALRLLDRVGLPSPRFTGREFPHQLSGGQRQRVMIAMALACRPSVLIADEPTTALDVTVQASILDLIDEIVGETGMSLVLISHDLGVIAEMTERVAVLYAGRIVELGPTADVIGAPSHPYTSGLLAASPEAFLGSSAQAAGPGRPRLRAIPGTIPDPGHRPAGCAFSDRCRYATDACRAAVPALEPRLDPNRQVACIHPLPGGSAP